MSLISGSRLGPYEILSPIGAGGMGEVFRAHDTKLNRDVAIKVLPAAFAEDRERVARFRREAQLVAALQHPNIAAIFGLEESNGILALVLELVDGEDLAEILRRGAIPLDEAVAIARQIAEGLEAAHEKGIVHRDLKPANIKLTTAGAVKILDFGLAKAYEGEASAASNDVSNSPTMARPMSHAGMILGTAAYMSPEQARGKTIDKRSDIWSFGVVLFEMLTGQRLFSGETVSDTLAAVLRQDVELSTLPEATPRALRRLVERCLERDPRKRLRDIGEARLALDELSAAPHGHAESQAAALTPGSAPRAPRSTWPARIGWLCAGTVLGALVVALLGRTLWRTEPAPPPLVRSMTYSGTSGSASISPDGRFVAFASARSGTSRIWLKQLATGEEVALTSGTDFSPRISPDSSTVLFGRASDPAPDLYRVPLVGGEPRRLARNIVSADWSPDGQQIAVIRNLDRKSQLFVIPANGGEEKAVLEQEDIFRGVSWSPDGKSLLIPSGSRTNTIANLTLRVVDLATRVPRDLYRAPGGSVISSARWDGNKAVLFAWSPSQAGRREALLERLVLGTPAPRPLFSFTSMPQRIDLAGPGALLYDDGGNHQNLFEMGTGTAMGRALTGGPTVDRQPSFSPDGTRIVFTSDRSGSLDLWSLELSTGAVRRLTFDAADDWDPHWSRDGKHLLWSTNKSGHFEIWRAEPDGTGARQVTADGVDAENPTMSADGSWIVYASSNPRGRGIWKVHPDGSGRTLLMAGDYSLPELGSGSGLVAAVGGVNTFSAMIRIVRLEDGVLVASVRVKSRRANPGRSRWMPDGRTLVFYADDEKGQAVLYEQPIVPGQDTTAQRKVIAVSDERRAIESFGVSPVDGRIVVSAGWNESDVLLAEGIPGIGESLGKQSP